jgi:hypothetical protein
MTRRLLVFLGAALACGCGHLAHDLAPLDLSGCPTEAGLAQDAFDCGSDSAHLACALGALRQDDRPQLRRTALGSKLCKLLAEREADPARRERLAAEGVRLAEEALALGAEDEGAVNYFLGANLGMAVRDHAMLAFQNLSRLHETLKKAHEKAPDVDQGGPGRILAMLYLKAPPWPKGIGDVDRALEILEGLVERHPDHPLNHLFYAQALWQAEEDGARAAVDRELGEAGRLLDSGRFGSCSEPWRKELGAFAARLPKTESEKREGE